MFYAPENFAKAYLSSRYSGVYQLIKAFSVEPYQIPAIILRMGRVEEIEPNCGVFSGTLSLAIITQINDDIEQEATHEGIVQTIYDYFSGENFRNYCAELPEFKVEHFYFENAENGREENNLKTVLNYAITFRNP